MAPSAGEHCLRAAIADQLANASVSFLDERGNADLSLDERTVLFIRTDDPRRTDVSAHAGPPAAKRAVGALALNRASHREAFALLCNPELAGGPSAR